MDWWRALIGLNNKLEIDVLKSEQCASPPAPTSYQSGISNSDYAAAKLGNQNKLKDSKIFSWIDFQRRYEYECGCGVKCERGGVEKTLILHWMLCRYLFPSSSHSSPWQWYKYDEINPHSAIFCQYYAFIGYCWSVILFLASSASKRSIRRFVITEKAPPTRAFSWLKAATTAFTLRHY